MSTQVRQIVVHKKLADFAKASSLMQELVRNIEPVLAARNWTIQRLIELCCCTKHRGPKSPNVQGFCQAAGDRRSAVVIALRLRRPGSHTFYSFNECFQTLVHEVAHITHGKHSADFYSLMEEIEKHWALSKSKGLAVVDEKGFPIHGGHKLPGQRRNAWFAGRNAIHRGKAGPPRQPTREEVRQRCLAAAMKRGKSRVQMNRLGLGRAYVLGGGSGSSSRSRSSSGGSTSGAKAPGIGQNSTPRTREELRQARVKFFRARDASAGLADEELEFNASQDGLAVEELLSSDDDEVHFEEQVGTSSGSSTRNGLKSARKRPSGTKIVGGATTSEPTSESSRAVLQPSKGEAASSPVIDLTDDSPVPKKHRQPPSQRSQAAPQKNTSTSAADTSWTCYRSSIVYYLWSSMATTVVRDLMGRGE